MDVTIHDTNNYTALAHACKNMNMGIAIDLIEYKQNNKIPFTDIEKKECEKGDFPAVHRASTGGRRRKRSAKRSKKARRTKRKHRT